MTKADACELVAILTAAYPAAKVPERTCRVYEAMLLDLDHDAAKRAVHRLIATAKWMPTIAEIRLASVEVVNGPRRLGGEAWGDVNAAVRYSGRYGVPEFGDPITADCVRQLGWLNVCNETNDVSLRARFIELYDGLAARGRMELTAGSRYALPKPENNPPQLRDVSALLGKNGKRWTIVMKNSKLKLHFWQRDAVERLIHSLRHERSVVGVAPTGSGKTVIGAALIRDTLPSARVLWFAHRFELLDQARKELIGSGMSPDDVGIWSGREVENEGARVLVCSVQMFQRGQQLPECDMVVIDEAHRAASNTYRRILENHRGYVLGLTATPWRLDGKPLGDLFNKMEILAKLTELEADGFVAAPITYGIPKDRARDIASKATGGADYNLAKLGREMSRRRLTGDAVAECAKHAPGMRTIVFAVNREHGKVLLKEFKAAGRTAAYLDGMTKTVERVRIIDSLRDGSTEVVVNVDVLAEGFDCPAVKCIAIARPTKSLTRFLQYCGRGARSYDGQRPIILDLGGNCWRHGLPNAERADDWTLDGRPAAKVGEMVKRCGECGALMNQFERVCPECGASSMAKQEIEEEQTELERAKWEKQERERKRKVLVELAKNRGLKGAKESEFVERLLKAAM